VGWRAEGQCGKMPRGCNWPRSSMSDARKAMHTHTSYEAETEASKRLSDAFRVADSTRPTTIHHVCAMRRGGKVRSRMQRAVPTTIHHVCAMRSLSAEYNFARAIPTTIHHVCAMRRGGKVRRKEVQHVRLSLTPAVFSARHFSRRPSVASGGHIRTRRPGPQADSPQHSKDCTRAAPGRQPRNPSNDCAIRQSQSDTD